MEWKVAADKAQQGLEEVCCPVLAVLVKILQEPRSNCTTTTSLTETVAR